MKEVFKIFNKYKYFVIISILFTFTQTMLNLNLPNIMSKIVNEGIVYQNIDNVYKYGINMLIVTLFTMACAIGATFMATYISSGYSKNLRSAVFKKVETLSLKEMKKISTSSLITRTTNDITGIQQLVMMSLRMMIMSPLMCIGGIYMSIKMNFKLSIIILVIIPVLITIILLLARKIIPLFSKIQN